MFLFTLWTLVCSAVLPVSSTVAHGIVLSFRKQLECNRQNDFKKHNMELLDAFFYSQYILILMIHKY